MKAFPDKDGKFADAWSTAANIPQYIVRNGAAGADERKMFNFSRANLIRVFGDRWHEAYTKITAYRLKKMGFNTIGVGTNDYYNERTREFLHEAKTPYVITFRTFPLTVERIFRDFPDVFGDEYRALCREFAARELTAYKDDPYLIGYFVTNEPEWLFAWNVNLCERLVSEPATRRPRRYSSAVCVKIHGYRGAQRGVEHRPCGFRRADGRKSRYIRQV